MRADQTGKNDLSCTRFSRLVHLTVNGRPVVRALTGTPKIACIDMKIRRIVRLPFSLTCCPLLPCKREVAAKRTNQGEPPAQTLEILSRLQGADTNYVIVRVFNIKGIYGIYRKVLYYLKILRRIFTFIIHSKYFTVSDWLKSPG